MAETVLFLTPQIGILTSAWPAKQMAEPVHLDPTDQHPHGQHGQRSRWLRLFSFWLHRSASSQSAWSAKQMAELVLFLTPQISILMVSMVSETDG